MPLEVHYTSHKAWNPNTKSIDPTIRKEADEIGHFLMTIGISEISEKTIDEVVIRKLILDQFYPSSAEYNKLPGDWHKIFKAHGFKYSGQMGEQRNSLEVHSASCKRYDVGYCS